MRKPAIARPAFTARDSQIEVVSPCVWYPMHTPSAGTFTDRMGNGPTFTIQGSGTADSLGRHAPAAANSTVYASAPADANLFSLLSMATLTAANQLLIAGVYQSTNAAVGASSALFLAGITNSAPTADGCLMVNTNNTEGLSVQIRGAGSGTIQSGTLTGAPMAVNDSAVAWCLDLRANADGVSVDVDFYAERLGASAASLTVSANIRTTGAAGENLPKYGSADNTGFTIGARQSGVGTYDQMLNGTAGDGGSLRDLIMMRRSTRTAGLGQLVARDLLVYPREFPRSLVGK